MQKYFFPTYLPNQKIQGKGTANKQFFNDGLRLNFIIVKDCSEKSII